MKAERTSRGARRYQPPDVRVQQVRAVGLSMFPAMLPGDRVDLVRAGTLSSGDVIAFVDADGCALAHRVIGRCDQGDHYLTAGDANLTADAPVPATAVIGKVDRVHRRVLGQWVEVPRWLWHRRLLSTRASRVFRGVAVRVLGVKRKIGGGRL